MNVYPHVDEPDWKAATKRCTHCRERKPVTDFYADPRNRDGLNTWCKQCYRDYAGIRRRAKRAADQAEREAAIHAQGQETIEQVAQLVYDSLWTTGDVSWYSHDEDCRNRVRKAAHAVIRWAATADRDTIAAAATVAGEHTE